MTYDYRPEPAYGLVRWTYGEVGLSTEDLMRPGTYSRPRSITRFPDRRLRASALVTSDGVASIQAKSIAAHVGQENYALRAELGDRAYAELTGKRIVRRPVAKRTPKALDTTARDAVRLRADGGHAVVLTDHEMMKALGIKPIGFLE